MGGRRRVPNDEGRRERIVEAALEVLTDHGVHKTTHRLIAERAGVPLGSVTYYFDGLPSILRAAFTLLASTMSHKYRSALTAATNRAQACEVVTDLICGPGYATPSEMTALFELYSYANHDAACHTIAREWIGTSRQSLAMHFSEDACRALDALIEGWPLHRTFEGAPLSRELVLATVRAVADRLDPE
ncbi:TetR/AcrR family transcriptional regulator [Actinoalloteichus hymeniacidonis]|uniref:Transcriptional regulator, TetR family n=1 Tax=Actinoalloteichus hymeniacidonis TaxID=340345 RepID=A0AAC9HTB3_9PSEU|nr:TetR family transcriptional regulator [Actinoalloteichus hymeniacidonis]AOS64100.1 transcriptional regulator, TetR family [Actinoalloteichus hymeniacidonis]MBB5907836.1 DNA-binding transcriptional regulator YbjK [Actinoalloteichus hymeniacidonis]